MTGSSRAKCSYCGTNGHNSRTCPRGVKLFGVRLTDGVIRKSVSLGNLTQKTGLNRNKLPSNGSASMGNLTQFTGLNSNTLHNNCSNPGSPGDTPEHGGGAAAAAAGACGYASEDIVAGSFPGSLERKKGIPWTEEEHRMFLLGLERLGKGDWRGIAHDYVRSRTPSQVASHAQKHFIRQSNIPKRKKKSLFDMIADESIYTPPVASQEPFPISNSHGETQSNNPLPAPPVASQGAFPISNSHGETQSNNPLPAPPAVEEECESMDITNTNGCKATIPRPESSQYSYPIVFPTYFWPYVPYPFPYWPGYPLVGATKDTHEVGKPTAVHSKKPVIVDEPVGMSKLNPGECLGHSGPSVSLKEIT